MNYGGLQYTLSTGSLEIYLSGCRAPHCVGCHNPELHDFAFGKPINNEFLARVNRHIDTGLINQIWLLGGEPLDQDLQALRVLLRWLHRLNRTVIVFTKYEIPEIQKMPKIREALYKYADYIKTGRYLTDKPADNYQWRGISLATSNQQIWPAHILKGG